MEGTDGGLKLRKVELKDFPNYKRKLVVQNIPMEVSEDEVMNYFYTVLSSISKEQCNTPYNHPHIRYRQQEPAHVGDQVQGVGVRDAGVQEAG